MDPSTPEILLVIAKGVSVVLGKIPDPESRCPFAICIGVLHTRCSQTVGHAGSHIAKGLSEFPYQQIEWFHGDSREYRTTREDEHAWSILR